MVCFLIRRLSGCVDRRCYKICIPGFAEMIFPSLFAEAESQVP